MHSESFVVPHPAGIHHATLQAFCNHFRPGTLRINGWDPTSIDSADELAQINHGEPVEIVAETGDSQTDRDAVHIAQALISKGRDPWQLPGQRMSLPLERYNQAANYVRENWLGLPAEYHGTLSKWRFAEVAAPVQMPDLNYVLDHNPEDQRDAGWQAYVQWTSDPQWADRTRKMNEAFQDMTWDRSEFPKGTYSPAGITWAQAQKFLLDRCWGEPHRSKVANAIPNEPLHVVNNTRSIEWVIEKVDMNYFAASKWRFTADVSSDMSVTSKWKVVALGELQQPGGVGATQDYNPVVDGPNPDGPEVDNASNSPEQEVAMQTWINTAVDMLNRGEDATTIIARLAHDGCPNPQEVLQRAQQQPMEEQSPVSDSIGQDAFKNPPPADQTGEMQGLSNQPPVLARVRIAGTSMTGTEVDRWEGLWGDGAVKVALDTGGTLEVAPSQVETIEDSSVASPVSEIQKFIDSMPPVEPSRPHIEARLANLEVVRRAVRANVSKVSLYDQQKLAEMDTAATEETALLKEALSNLVEEHEVGYFSHLPRYQYNAFDVATPEIKAWSGRPREAGAIWASENFTHAVDKDEFTAVAAHYASTLGLTGSQFEQFLAGAFEDGLKSLPPVTSEDDPNAENIVIDNEGPADALFV